MKFWKTTLFFILSLSSTLALSAEVIDPPKNWNDEYDGSTRVVGNGNATVRIYNWERLGSNNTQQWLSSLKNENPVGGQLVSSDEVKPERVSGAYSVSRKATFAGSTGISVFYACPGRAGNARLITIDVNNGKFKDVATAAIFAEKSCRDELKGEGSENSLSSTLNTLTNAGKNKPSNNKTTKQLDTQSDTQYDPSGWSKTVDVKNNAISFKKAGNSSIVKIYPKTLLEKHKIDSWLKAKIESSNAPRGKWNNDLQINRYTANLASSKRSFTLGNGEVQELTAFAFTADSQYVRFGVAIYPVNGPDFSSANDAINLASNKVRELELADAKRELRELDLERRVRNIDGIKQGLIAIKPGRYAGTTRFPSGSVNYEIVLYENGEYEYPGKQRPRSKDGVHYTGTYRYSLATSRLDINGQFFNNDSTRRERVTVYGIDEATGQHIIYGLDDGIETRLLWVDPPKTMPPRFREEIEKQKSSNDKRYKYTTAPGDGIQTDNVEAVLQVQNSNLSIGGDIHISNDVYLLMKDGRVIDGMPVAPFMLDVAKSRSREPDRWGWWNKDGYQYSFAWDVERRNYTMPSGTQASGKPFAKGARISGQWKKSESYTVGDGGSVYTSGVIFSKDGRFKEFNSSISQAGGSSSGGPLVTSVSDDKGTTTVVAGANVGGGSSNRSNSETSHLEGTYELDGYNLTLNYDNGETKTRLTFYSGEDYRSIWFNGKKMQR